MYDIIYSPLAKDDLLTLQRSEPAAFRKAAMLIEELKVHPRTGTGHPEPLSADRAGAMEQAHLQEAPPRL